MDDKKIYGESLTVSIITVVYNNVKYIRDAIQSVLSQDYPYVEYVIIDGGSSDGTIEAIEEFSDQISVFISEPDNGIFDALNKGVQSSSGDVVGILHSDDLFCDTHVVTDMVELMLKTKSEFGFADMLIIDNNDRIIRYYMAHYFKPWMFRIGWLPPHPTCFIKKSIFNEFGLFSLEYKLVGDFDFFVRIFYGRKITWAYLNRVTVKMRIGGASNSGFSSKRRIAYEINCSLKQNNVWSFPLLQWLRYLIRMMEFIVRPTK
jgi:glycosyltransferase involved in cell wall biosynthesis